MASVTVQILVAIFLILAFLIIGFAVYNMETIKALQYTGRTRKITNIFDGIKDLKDSNNEIYNTLDKSNTNYIEITPSVNQYGGTEYSYNFWLYIDNTNNKLFTAVDETKEWTKPDAGLLDESKTKPVDSNDLPVVLFLRGNPKPYIYKNLCYTDKKPELKTDILVKSPLVKLERGGDVLSVEINTVSSPDSVKEQSRNTCIDKADVTWKYMNSYKIALQGLSSRRSLQAKWFMVSIVLKDTYPTDPYPVRNKIRAQIYINGEMELDKYINSGKSNPANPIKSNEGNFYIAPSIKYTKPDGSLIQLTRNNINSDKTLMMCDMKYANYALTPGEIKSFYEKGITKSYALNNKTSTDVNNFMDSLSTERGNLLKEL